ncbi:MAG: MerC domain-containing protein [Deltaproteobacteria bacterium]|nr:MerC domain-containing protein [Deltaproteobacteria bacterium]
MPRVELVYDSDCPNVPDARTQLLRAFEELDLPPHWQEWCFGEPEVPEHARGYGSPTILVDKQAVGGSGQIDGTASCRVYATAEGIRGVPGVEEIVAALRGRLHSSASTHENAHGRWKSSVAILPAVGMSLLPKLACPACWPAYAGLMSSVGLGFLVDTTYLRPLTGVFLALAVGALAFRVSRRRGYGPFALGLLAACTVLVGKFALDSGAAMYGGVAVLIAASLWNGWPKHQEAVNCPACAQNPAPSQT